MDDYVVSGSESDEVRSVSETLHHFLTKCGFSPQNLEETKKRVEKMEVFTMNGLYSYFETYSWIDKKFLFPKSLRRSIILKIFVWRCLKENRCLIGKKKGKTGKLMFCTRHKALDALNFVYVPLVVNWGRKVEYPEMEDNPNAFLKSNSHGPEHLRQVYLSMNKFDGEEIKKSKKSRKEFFDEEYFEGLAKLEKRYNEILLSSKTVLITPLNNSTIDVKKWIVKNYHDALKIDRIKYAVMTEDEVNGLSDAEKQKYISVELKNAKPAETTKKALDKYVYRCLRFEKELTEKVGKHLFLPVVGAHGDALNRCIREISKYKNPVESFWKSVETSLRQMKFTWPSNIIGGSELNWKKLFKTIDKKRNFISTLQQRFNEKDFDWSDPLVREYRVWRAFGDFAGVRDFNLPGLANEDVDFSEAMKRDITRFGRVTEENHKKFSSQQFKEMFWENNKPSFEFDDLRKEKKLRRRSSQLSKFQVKKRWYEKKQYTKSSKLPNEAEQMIKEVLMQKDFSAASFSIEKQKKYGFAPDDLDWDESRWKEAKGSIVGHFLNYLAKKKKVKDKEKYVFERHRTIGRKKLTREIELRRISNRKQILSNPIFEDPKEDFDSYLRPVVRKFWTRQYKEKRRIWKTKGKSTSRNTNASRKDFFGDEYFEEMKKLKTQYEELLMSSRTVLIAPLKYLTLTCKKWLSENCDKLNH